MVAPSGHLNARAESASLATIVGAGSWTPSGFGDAARGRCGGYRPAIVQQVEGERNEQSGSGRGVVEADWAAAHPESSAMLSSAGVVRVGRLGFRCMIRLSRPAGA